MRLVYLDEAGTTGTATALAVAGVIVHGDDEWAQVDQRIRDLIDKYIPEPDRMRFVFHATDIFHGARYFDRSKPEWESRDSRWPILADLAQILADFSLPVVFGSYDRSTSVEGALNERERFEGLHVWSVVDCLYWADLWLAINAPTENAAVVHEDGPSAKPVIKQAVRALRYPEAFSGTAGRSTLSIAEVYALPFDHIVDTVHFAEKADARFLQLADLCAFALTRALQGRFVPQDVLRIMLERTYWMRKMRGRTSPIADVPWPDRRPS